MINYLSKKAKFHYHFLFLAIYSKKLLDKFNKDTEKIVKKLCFKIPEQGN